LKVYLEYHITKLKKSQYDNRMASYSITKEDRLLIDKVVPCNSKSEAERILAQKGVLWTGSYKGGKHTLVFTNSTKHIAVWFRLWRILEIL